MGNFNLSFNSSFKKIIVLIVLEFLESFFFQMLFSHIKYDTFIPYLCQIEKRTSANDLSFLVLFCPVPRKTQPTTNVEWWCFSSPVDPLDTFFPPSSPFKDKTESNNTPLPGGSNTNEREQMKTIINPYLG